MGRMMGGRLKVVLRLAATILVIAFWGGYLWRNWDNLVSYGWQVDFGWLLLSFLAGVIYWVLLAVIWQRVLVAVGGSLGMFGAVRLWTMSMLGRYVPGGVWHIASRVYMAEKAGESRATVFIATVIEQILSILGALLMLLVSLPFWNADYVRLTPLLLLALPLAVAAHPAVLRRLAVVATRFASRGKAQAVAVSSESLPTLGYGSLLALFLTYVVPNLCAALALYFSAAAVGEVSLRQLPAFAGAFAVAWIVGYFSFFAPGGLGVREGAIALILTPVVGAPMAVAAGVLSRLAISFGEAATVVGCVGGWGLGDGRRETGDGGR